MPWQYEPQGYILFIVACISFVIVLGVLRWATAGENKNLEQNHEDHH